MKQFTVSIILLAAMLAGLAAPVAAAGLPSAILPPASSTAQAAEQDFTFYPPLQTKARLEPRSCVFENTPNLAQGLEMDCYWLTVPETWEDLESPTIRLSVAIIRSGAAKPDPVPVIFLQGGPGGSTIDTYLQVIPLDPRLRALNRDIILFDQRGTMYSEPSLFCEEVYQEGIDVMNEDIPEAEADQRYLDAMKACRETFSHEGYNLSAFDSLENAADVEGLRQALGLGKVHIYGVSYGTLLAQHVMRQYPEGLASVTLDSVMPPQVPAIADQPRVLNRGLENLFSSCAADSACSRAYPNLKEVFYQQVDRLNADKAHITLTNYKDGKDYPALLDGDTVMSAVIQMLYSTSLVPLIPRAIYQVRAGNYQAIEKILSTVVFDRSINYGMFYSVWCAEEDNFDPRSVDLSALPPELRDEQEVNLELFVQACKFWDVEKVDQSASQPVQSSVPTLVLSGAFDPVTPPEYGEEAAASLANHYAFTFPNGGHGAVTSGECQDQLFIDFMNNPSAPPNSGCVAEQKMVFSTPGALVPAPSLLSLVNPTGTNLVLLGIYGLGLLFLLTALLVYPIVWLVRLFRRPTPAAVGPDGLPVVVSQPLRKPLLYRLAPWMAALAGGALLVFIIAVYGITIQMALANDNRVLFGLPGSARPLFLLPLAALAAVVIMLLGALAAWARGAGSVWGRLYLTLLTIAGIACVAVLGYYGLLHAFFLG